MRNLLIIGTMLLGMFMAGWFTINREGDTTTIEIDRSEIRSDTRQVIDRGRDFLERQEFGQEDATQWADQPYQQGTYQGQQQYLPEEQIATQPYWQQPYNQQPTYGNDQQYPPSYDNQSYGNQSYENLPPGQSYWPPAQDQRYPYQPAPQQYPLPPGR